jgi:predicted ATPase/class 3 adenylate cyclase
VREELPRGTVTFLFTDVEGSTRLLDELGAEDYAAALAEHRRLIRDACSRHGGVEVDTQGDAFFFAFPAAPDGLSAAADMTEALAGGRIRVRIGVHTGRRFVMDEGYVGDDVHVAARVAAASHGGQVVLTHATRELLDERVALSDLGEHRLKDIAEPVAIFQLGDGSFPPLKTISNTNLPRPASSFVGRERELEEVLSKIGGGARLVTLTGPGGSGKTRLAIEAAASLVTEYKAGVFWVGLAALRDPALVTETIAQTLGAKDGLAEHIGERELLLLIDNLEQVIESAPGLSALLSACPNLTLLVTSRELLRVQGEVEYPVPPLAEPEAVALFCERAQLEPSEDVARLCARLDNLPLAVELAAARTKALTPAQILERLAQRLDVLKGGRDADPRQQTLRATIEWSHDLLDAEEQELFRRLSVFAGGCTLEAAENVAGADLDTLQSLVEKSLLRFTNERYRMLETIREFADDRLEEREEVQGLYARYYLALGEEAEPELQTGGQARWLSRLDAEHENLRAALTFLRDSSSAEEMLRLAVAIYRFWFYRGFLHEGRHWLAEALEHADADITPVRSKALAAAAQLAYRQGAYAEATSLNDVALSAFRALGDRSGVGRVLNQLADVAEAEGDLARAERLWTKSVAMARRSGSRYELGVATANLGSLMLMLGDYKRAVALTSEGLAIFEELGNEHGAAVALENLGCAAIWEGRYADAVVLLRQSLVRFRELHTPVYVAHALAEMAVVSALTGQVATAARLMGAVDRILADTGGELAPDTRALQERGFAAIRERLDESAFATAHAEGGERTVDEAVELALEATVD